MNLKKSDKIIAIVTVLILIVAAVGIVAYVSTTEEEDTEDEMETMTYDVLWTKKTSEMEITGEALPSYTDPFTITTSSGSVLTNVDVKISWEDDYVQKGLLGMLFASFIKGYDTLTADIGLSGNTQTHTSTGEGNETLYFTVNSKPVDDFVDAEDRAEVEDTIDYNYGGKNSASFDVDINVEVGKGKGFLRKFINNMQDKGDDFTLTVTYNYYTYEIVEQEPVDDNDDVEEESLSLSYMEDIRTSNMKYW